MTRDVRFTPERKAARMEAHTLESQNGCSTRLFSRDPKRGRDPSIISAQPKSKAAKFNAHTLRKLQAAFDKDPEIDLTAQMPMDYTVRLVQFQEEFQEKAKESHGKLDEEQDVRKANRYS